MLVLDAARLDREEQKIARLPIDTFAVDHGISLADDHVDDEAALVAMLAGLGLEVVREHAPVLQRCILMDLRIEMIHQPALPRDVELAVGGLQHHLPGLLPLQELAPAVYEA